MRHLHLAFLFVIALGPAPSAQAQAQEKWVTAWAASVQGPYPVGNPSAQPDLRFAFPSPASGARDQTFRLEYAVAPRLPPFARTYPICLTSPRVSALS